MVGVFFSATPSGSVHWPAFLLVLVGADGMQVFLDGLQQGHLRGDWQQIRSSIDSQLEHDLTPSLNDIIV
jgi:hypothetical protein